MIKKTLHYKEYKSRLLSRKCINQFIDNATLYLHGYLFSLLQNKISKYILYTVGYNIKYNSKNRYLFKEKKEESLLLQVLLFYY